MFDSMNKQILISNLHVVVPSMFHLFLKPRFDIQAHEFSLLHQGHTLNKILNLLPAVGGSY